MRKDRSAYAIGVARGVTRVKPERHVYAPFVPLWAFHALL